MHQADDIAAGHARLDAAHPGRVLLGLGVSHGPLIDRNGPRYGRPLAVMDAFLDGLDSASPPVPVAERVLAALGPKMLERARDRAAGAHPYLTTPDHTAGARAILGPDRLLAPEIMVVVDDDPTRARAIARQTLSGYLPRLPNYANNLRRSGFGDDDLAEGLSDRLVDALVPAGLEAIAGRVREHLDAGADHVCLQVLTQRPTELPRTEWRALGQLVAEFG
jgi:probable F420-dependent oxidoreductase